MIKGKLVFRKQMKTEAEEVVEEEGDLDMRKVFDAVTRFNLAFDSIENVLVGKHAELLALKYCILTGQHLLLVGAKGCAKSMLGNLAFSLIEGAKVFRKQFHKGTQVDEIFGPMDSRLYREKAIWQHNIANMLPDCHFANLDELFRASDMLLPTMMEILNERQFRHGTKYIDCPLMTAIGTTNFTSDNEELAAFSDRWSVTVDVSPLTSAKARVEAVKGHISRRKNPRLLVELPKVTLADVKLLQDAVRKVEMPEEAYALYEELVSTYIKKVRNDKQVSDRRFCHSLSMAQAAHILSLTEDTCYSDFSLGSLGSTAYGLFSVNDNVQGAAFVDAYQSVVEVVLKDSDSFRKHKKILAKLTQWERTVDKKMDKDSALLIYKQCSQVAMAMRDLPPGTVSSKANQTLVDEIIQKAERMVNDVSVHIPRKAVKQQVSEEGCDEADEADEAVVQ